MTYTRQFGLQARQPVVSSGKSPFTIVPIPSINKTQPDDLPPKVHYTLGFSFVRRREREGGVGVGGGGGGEGERERCVHYTLGFSFICEVR